MGFLGEGASKDSGSGVVDDIFSLHRKLEIGAALLYSDKQSIAGLYLIVK